MAGRAGRPEPLPRRDRGGSLGLSPGARDPGSHRVGRERIGLPAMAVVLLAQPESADGTTVARAPDDGGRMRRAAVVDGFHAVA